jgi:hypothetical protein
MDEAAIERATRRLAQAAEGRSDPAVTEAALERARAQIEQLAQVAAELETTLPAKVGDAVRDGLRAETLPVARQLAEVRGLTTQTIRRLEGVAGEVTAERNARVDDLALLVDLITAGWKGVDDRLARIEQLFEAGNGAIVYRIEEHRTGP